MSIQSSDELQPISNTKFPDKPKIIQTKFCDYIIRYLDDKTGKKFLVTDLLNQYAKNNNKQRIKLENYLRLQNTQNLIDELAKEYNTSNSNSNNVLEKYSFEGYDFTISSEAYVMNEDLLIDCLRWLDKIFASKFIRFLSELSNEENIYLKQQLENEKKNKDILKLVLNKLESNNSKLTNDKNKLITENNQLDNKLSVLNKVNEELELKKIELNCVNNKLIQVRNNYNNIVNLNKSTKTWSLCIKLIKNVKFNQVKIQLNYIDESIGTIRNLNIKQSLFCLMCIPCSEHDIQDYCLNEFQNILESYHGVKTAARSYTMNLRDYLDTSVDIDTIDFDTCEYYELKPKQELLTDLKEIFETIVKDNHWNNTRLMYMFS